jgi:16S rRNA (guanine527-N7)-methyltransferase
VSEVGSPGRTPAEVTDLVDELVQRWSLPARSGPALCALLDLIVRDDRAPTTVRDPVRAVEDHLADALVALELECVRSSRQIADIGSGAGFPGLPLAIALPEANVFLLESNARKCEFLRDAVAAIGVENAVVVEARAEDWTDAAGRHDLVTARALAPLPVVAEYAAPLLRLGGVLVAWRGRRDEDAEAQAAAAAAELGLEPANPRRVVPYRGAQHRYLHPMSKVSATPARFPRRAGMALKRPLGERRRSAAASDRARR